MKDNTYPDQVEPGRRVFRLTKEETCAAAFYSAMGRKPTLDESRRLSLQVKDNQWYSENKWELVLVLMNQNPNKPEPERLEG